MTIRIQIGAIALALLCGHAYAQAAPIRVGILKGTSSSNIDVGINRHTNINTATSVMRNILAHPDTANLGPNLIVPAVGFETIIFGPDSVGSQMGGTQWAPTTTQFTAFFNALDSLDVVWIPNYSLIGTSITDSVQRQRLERFIRTKGFVSTHFNTSGDGSWPAWDSIHGARLVRWGNNPGPATVHLDSASSSDPCVRFLNRGLPDTARIIEDWNSFVPDGSAIRAKFGLKVTINLDEASVSTSYLPQQQRMGDHPISWFRNFPEGGRFFYTALGHRSQSYLGTGTGTPGELSFLRRQLYNAILWAAGVDSNGVVSTRPAARASAQTRADIRVSANEIHVQVAEEAPYRVDLHALNGKRVASLQASKDRIVTFKGLQPHTVYLVSIVTPRSRESRRVLVP